MTVDQLLQSGLDEALMRNFHVLISEGCSPDARRAVESHSEAMIAVQTALRDSRKLTYGFPAVA